MVLPRKIKSVVDDEEIMDTRQTKEILAVPNIKEKEYQVRERQSGEVFCRACLRAEWEAENASATYDRRLERYRNVTPGIKEFEHYSERIKFKDITTKTYTNKIGIVTNHHVANFICERCGANISIECEPENYEIFLKYCPDMEVTRVRVVDGRALNERFTFKQLCENNGKANRKTESTQTIPQKKAIKKNS